MGDGAGGGDPGATDLRFLAYEGELGLRLTKTIRLWRRLESDLAVESFGFEKLADIEDLTLRAVVSDQITQAPFAAMDQLAEAKLHFQRLDKLLKSSIARYPKHRDGDTSEVLRDVQLRAELTGFFRAIFSALDCMSSAAIGITRAPKSLTRASFNDLLNITELTSQSDKQTAAWEELDGLIQAQIVLQPQGWWDWILAMRNSQIHRPRQMTVFLATGPLPRVTRLELPESAKKAIGGLIKFSMHLRKQPGVPDMQNFAKTSRISDLIVAEEAQDTLLAILDRVNHLIEELSGLLDAQWLAIEGAADGFASPTTKWKLVDESEAFEGSDPTLRTISTDFGVANPSDAKRFAIGERLRVMKDSGSQSG